MVDKGTGKLVNGFMISNTLLGKGAFGQVFLGNFEKEPDRKVAVKVIPVANIPKKNSKEFTKLLKREIDIMRKLTESDSIVTMYDCALTANNLYMFLDFCDGGDLSQLLKKETKISEERAVRIFRDIVNAFRACNQQNVIHRDIKPANIMLKSDGSAYVNDFGFARTIEGTSGDEKNKYTMLGTPLYMAPQLLMEEAYSSKADIWSVAMIFYEMLFGYTPYTGKSPYQLYQNIINGKLEFPSDTPVSDQTKDILQKMLASDEDKRLSWKDIFDHPLVKK